jgi:orotidine-5'-phosphate decarboxylase
MTEFMERMRKCSNSHKSKLVLALDHAYSSKKDLLKFADDSIRMFGEHICAVKINFHLLLPLDLYSEIKFIVEKIHALDLQVIADMKLNDISNTNDVALSHLWSAGFDALTVNPFIGYDSLKDAIANAHTNKNGVIALVYMSHRSAADTYGLKVVHDGKSKYMYELFLDWAAELGADGMIVGATIPAIIQQCSQKVNGKVAIFSPGVGTQGGDPKEALANGADYLIVGRSIIDAKNPREEAARIQRMTWIS